MNAISPFPRTTWDERRLWGRIAELRQSKSQVHMGFIIGRVATAYGLTVSAIVGGSREAYKVEARHLAMKLCREQGYSLPQIGRAFGGRDHTTVLHALRKFEQPGEK